METTNVERLKEYIESNNITEDQAGLFVTLLNQTLLFDYRKKMDFMLSKEDQNKIDSATPADLNRQLAEILPREQFPQLAYDYRENKIFGTYLNLDRLFLEKITELFR